MARAALLEIDLSDIETVRQAHERFARVLRFPDYYGPNWDAFWDAILNVEMPRRLIIFGMGHLETKFPRDAAILPKCFADAVEQWPAKASDYDFVEDPIGER